jgi:flagellar motor switch protein FliG
MLPASLRKAAILVQALDEAAADALLEQMGPEQAAKVRSALMELDAIPPAEERQIVAEFLGRPDATSAANPAASSGGVELELSSASESLADGYRQAPVPPTAVSVPTDLGQPPFAFLLRIGAPAIAREIAREQPQMVAAVLAQLPPEQAAAVLEALPTNLATDSLERMATIDGLSPEVLLDLAGELKTRLAPQLLAQDATPQSLDRLSSVLAAMDSRQRERLTTQLTSRNLALANRLGLHPSGSPLAEEAARTTMLRYRLDSAAGDGQLSPPRTASRNSSPHAPTEFADLADLDDASLRNVFAAAEPEVVLLALIGAEQRLIDRVLRKLTAREAQAFRRRLDSPGPMRLREIDAAQRKLAELADRLAATGEVRFPRPARFAAAA